MLLSEARERVRFMVDADSFDSAGDRWTTAEVDQKLKLALEATCTIYAGKGGQRLDQVVSLTSDTDGYISLQSTKPIQILGVRVLLGNQYVPIAAVAAGQIRQNATSAWTVKIRVIPTPVFPTGASSEITYGNSTSWEIMDEMICIRAAKSLLVKDGEIDQALEAQFQELLTTMLSSENTIKVFNFPSFQDVQGTFPNLVYDWSPHSLTLGYT